LSRNIRRIDLGHIPLPGFPNPIDTRSRVLSSHHGKFLLLVAERFEKPVTRLDKTESVGAGFSAFDLGWCDHDLLPLTIRTPLGNAGPILYNGDELSARQRAGRDSGELGRWNPPASMPEIGAAFYGLAQERGDLLPQRRSVTFVPAQSSSDMRQLRSVRPSKRVRLIRIEDGTSTMFPISVADLRAAQAADEDSAAELCVALFGALRVPAEIFCGVSP
jgi:hypothetical protein